MIKAEMLPTWLLTLLCPFWGIYLESGMGEKPNIPNSCEWWVTEI